ncbi:MAG: cadmium-translocating P-type ATPase [Lactobacillaceae bacterium]|jgi:Cu2+-exporting ATPase|nr:cadmium-translocating P-type ATPase [Lactobacillaceae bacterium]
MKNHEHDHNHESQMNMNHTSHIHTDDMNMQMHSSTSNYLKRFFLVLILSVPIFLFSPFMGMKAIIANQSFNFVVPIFASLILVVGGSVFFKHALMEIKTKKPEMMSLISLGLISSYLFSIYSFFTQNSQMNFFWELATLTLIMLLGHYIEEKALNQSQKDLNSISNLLPQRALIKHPGGHTMSIPLEDVQINDTLIVKANQKIPTDGFIVKGSSYLNESLLSGEVKPVFKQVGDQVVGGSINGDSEIQIRVEKIGKDSFISQIKELVLNAQLNKSQIQLLADKVAGWLFYIAIVVSFIAFIYWLILAGNLPKAAQQAVTVLVIACPHALGLAVPLVIARSISLAIKNNILVKNQQVNQVAPDINYAIFDKTGTLTDGVFSVENYDSLNKKYSRLEILAMIIALEQHSNHPIAKSILNYKVTKKLPIYEVNNFMNMAGTGLMGQINDYHVMLTNLKYLKENNLQTDHQDPSTTTSYLLIDGQVAGYISLEDKIKKDSKYLISQLKKHGIHSLMLTGDNYNVANNIAEKLEVDFQANLLPKDKLNFIEELQSKGNRVLMVGDGVNDAPSLAKADIGISVFNGTDVAQDSADVLLLKDDNLNILKFLTIAKNTKNKIISNLWLGAGYNIIAIPLAAGILAFAGIVLSPSVGAILMIMSTIIVSINAISLHD